MKRIISSLLLLLGSQTLSIAQTFNWASAFNPSIVHDFEYDSQGNIYVVGEFYNQMDADPTAGVQLLTGEGSSGFIVKLNASGQFIWANNVQPADLYGSVYLGQSVISGIEIDANDNFYIYGDFSFKVDLGLNGASKVVTQLTLSGSRDASTVDAFVAKYNSNGVNQWAASYGGTYSNAQHYDDWIRYLHVSNSGKVYMSVQGASGDFNTSTSLSYSYPGAAYSSYIWILNNDGTFNSVRSYESYGIEYVSAIETDSQENIYLSGVNTYYQTDYDFGPGVVSPSIFPGYNVFYIAKYDQNFNYQWVNSVTSGNFSKVKAHVANDNEIYTLAYCQVDNFGDSIDLDPSANVFNTGVSAYAVSKFDGAGNTIFAKNIYCDVYNTDFKLNDLQVNNSKVYINGSAKIYDPQLYVANKMTFGNQKIVDLPSGSNDMDFSCFILNISSTGDFIDLNQVSKRLNTNRLLESSAPISTPFAMRVKSNNKILLLDGFNYTTDLDPSNGVYNVVPSDSCYKELGVYYGTAHDNYITELGDCIAAGQAQVQASNDTICNGGSVNLSLISGNLNTNTSWVWYANSLPGSPIGTGTSVSVSPSSTTSYFVRGEGACYSNGIPSSALQIVVLPSNTQVSSVTTASACVPSSLTLQATNNNGVLNWYDAPSGGNQLGTGNSFTTPMISSSTTYYVESVSSCATSARVPVLAEIKLSTTMPYIQDFEGAFPPAGWSISSTDAIGSSAWGISGNKTWQSVTTGGLSPGTKSVGINIYNYPYSNQRDNLSSILVDLGSSPNPVLDFQVSYAYYNLTAVDTLNVFVSSDCGATFTRVYNKYGTALATAGQNSNSFMPSLATHWRRETIDLTPFAGQQIFVKIQTVSRYGNNLFIDDFRIHDNCFPPTVVAQASNANVCESASGSFSVQTSDLVNDQFQWEVSTDGGTSWNPVVDNSIYSNATSSTLSLNSIPLSFHNNQYRCVMTSCSSITGTPVTLQVNPTPAQAVITPSGSTSFCSGSSVVLNSSASNGNLWSTGASGTSINVTQSGTYSVTVSLNGCTSSAASQVVTVTPSPQILSYSNDRSCVPAQLTLSATADLGIINWYDAAVGGNLLGTGGTFTTPMLSDTTDYYVEASNNGCLSGRNLIQALIGGGTQAVNLLSPTDLSTNTNSNLNYTWSADPAALSYTIQISSDPNFSTFVESVSRTQSNYNSDINLGSNNTYFWRVRSNGICDSTFSQVSSFTTGLITCFTVSSSTPLTIPTTVSTVTSTINVSNDFLINNIEFTDLQGTHSYINDLRITLISPAGTEVVLIDQICGSEDNFNVKFSNGTSMTNAQIPCPPTDGNYYQPLNHFNAFDNELSQGIWTLKIEDLSASDGGILNSWSINICGINQCTPPSILTSSGDEICGAGSLGLSATASAGSISWYDAPNGGNLVGSGNTFITPVLTNSTTYYAEANSSGCLSPRTAVDASILAIPTISSNGSTSICDGQAIILTAAISGGNTWSTSETTNSITVATAGVYTVSNVNGCSDDITIIAATIPNAPVITASGSTTICDGDQLNISSSASSGNVWSNGETSTSISVSTSGTFSVTQTVLGCTSPASNSISVTVNPLPSVSMSSLDTFCLNAPAFTLSNGSPSGGTYLGTAVNGSDFDPSLGVAGNNQLIYTFTDQNACTNSDTILVVLENCAGIDELSNSGILIYPNPGQGLFEISTPNGIQEFEVKDSFGKIIEKQSGMNQLGLKLDLTRLADGVYFLSINGEHSTYKLLKN